MTLVEMERLIRRIEEAMERPPGDAALPKLAADYSALCHAAVQRLNQCASMIAVGDEHQALQLAEAAPPLLDQLTLLSFRRSPNWRALCRAENLPTPENFEIKPIRQLNELYARGIDKDHALYREYRRAVMLNDDVRALAVLRSIARLNANDKNARAELDRLEHKSRSDKIHHLEKLVRDKAPAQQISTLAEELESVSEAQQSSAWIPAQTIRAHELLDHAREAQRTAASDELQQILHKLPGVTHLLNESERGTLDELERWSSADAARRKEASSRRAAILQLSEIVARLEQDQVSARKRSLQELRNSAETLERAWRQVEHFRAEVAGDIATRAQKLRDSLRLQIERSVNASRRLAFAAVALVVVICIGAAWMAYSRQSANALGSRLHALIAERRVAETEAALNKAANQLATPSLINARQAGEEFLRRERALKAASDQALATVDATARLRFTNAPPERIAVLFQSARNANAALAPEFRAAADAALAKINAVWRDFIDRERSAGAERLSTLLTPIEAAAERELQYSRDPAEVAASSSALKKQIELARPLVDTPIPELRPKQEALFRFENLETRIDKFARDATNWFAAQRQLSSATNLASYNSALQLLASNGFTPPAQRAAVATLAGLNLSGQNLLAPLLLPNGPASALSETPRVSRVPDEVLTAEREIQRRLRDDENIHNVSRLEIEIKSLPAENPRRRRTILLRGELQRRITRRSGQIYDPVESPAALQFVPKEMSSLDYSVEEPSAPPERELYERAGLSRLIDSNSGKYQISLLQSLDDINQDRRASPLFRAWLFLRICEMIDVQPAQWGAIWSPALAADRASLERLGTRQINSGDWFIPRANAQRAAALNAHFDRAALHSYARQAAFFKRLLPKASEGGVRVVGYINGEGQPVLNDTRAYSSVWAIAAANQPPQMIFENVSPNQRPRQRTQAMLYSPLFVIAGNSADLINSTLQSLGYSAAAVNAPESLPPILRSPP